MSEKRGGIFLTHTVHSIAP